MKRLHLTRLFNNLIALTLFVVPTCRLIAAESKAKKPNVVLIVSDDMGWKDVGFHGSEIRTPNLDRLVAEGVELDRFYAYPICSPTRVALMTGRSPIRYGILSPVGKSSKALPVEEFILPQAFKAAGYETFMTGKWHLGVPDETAMPHRRGFDHYYGFLSGFIDYYTHTDTRRRQLDWMRNGKLVNEEGYSTDLLADEAVRLVEGRDRAKPFFLYLPFGAAHTPLQAPEKVIAKYNDITDRDRRVYAAMVDAMDSAIGRVLEAVGKQGVLDDTLVIYFNDNGGARAGADNGHLAKGKGSVYEGGIRVAAAMRWPPAIPAGKKSSQLTSVMDLFPTLIDAAGIERGQAKPFDGRSVWPAIKDGKKIRRDGVVIASPQELAVLRGQWKYIRSARENSQRASRLFDVVKDPGETTDLAGKKPDLAGELDKATREFLPMMANIAPRGRGQGGSRTRGLLWRNDPLLIALDENRDSQLSATELGQADAKLRALDRNKDGKLSADELGLRRR